MNIIEKNRLDISNLKLKFNWDQKSLKFHFPTEHDFRRLGDPEKGETRTFVKLLSLICIFFLTLLVVPYIPINIIKNSLNAGIPYANVYIGVTVIGIYLFWLFSRIWTRRKVRGDLHLFSMADLIPLIIGFVIYIIHFKPDYFASNGNSINTDPIGYFVNYGLNSESTTLFSEFVTIFMGLFALYLIAGGCIYVIYSAWLSSPSEFHKLMELLVEKRITHKRKIKEGRDFGLIGNEKIFWKIPKIGRKKIEKIDCYVKTILPDTNLVNLWKLNNPKYVRSFFIGLGIGFYLMYMCFGAIDQILYDPEMATVDNRLTMISFFVLSILSIISSLYFIKGLIVGPIVDYYRLKKHVNIKIEKTTPTIYEKVGTESNDIGTVLELLFLKECLENHKKLPLLPMDNPISSLALYLPLVSPFIIIILSKIF